MAAGAMAATPTVDRYAEGQVWEYQTRPGDQGSLLKIQKIEVRRSLLRLALSITLA
jgi:hypothetical protein